MRKRVIPWALLIFFALILYLFSNESVTLALLIAVIAALPLSFAMLKLTYKHFELEFLEDEGMEGGFILKMRNTGALPIASAEAEIRCTNLRTGENDSYVVTRDLMPHRVKDIKLNMHPVHAGRYELSVTSARVLDPLGIWSKELSFSDTKAMTVLPEIYDMQMITEGSATMPESDREAQKSRGAVSGDMIGIREYVPGDPVRNIHWKLSEKNDKMLVKELGNPVTDQFLLILDSTPEIAQDPVALDAVASVYTSMIRSLMLDDLIVDASWTDPLTGEAVMRRISDQHEFNAAADEYLAVPALMPGAYQLLERDIADSRYVHVVYVGTKIPANIENITNGCQATVLMYGGISFSDRNLSVIGFDAKTYKSDTAGIEV